MALPATTWGACGSMSSSLPNVTVRKSGLTLLSMIALGLAGCASRASPSWTLFGAYFPAWLLCGLLGVFGALAARFGFVATGLATVIPFQIWVCTAIGIMVASLCWLVWLGQ
jgi:hypothetical protein